MGAVREDRKPRQVPPGRERARGKDASQPAQVSRAHAPMSPSGLLSVQALAGNRAATRLVQGNGGPLPVQREGGESGVAVQEREEPSLQEQVDRHVATLPPIDEAVLPAPQNVEMGKEEVSGAQEEIRDLGLGRGGAMDAWVQREQGGSEGVESEVREIQESRGDATLDTPSKPTRGQRFMSAMSGAGSKAWGGLKSAGGWAWGGLKSAGSWLGDKLGISTKEGRHEKGAKGLSAAGMISPTAKHSQEVLTVGQNIVDNPATKASAALVGGSHAVDKVSSAGTTMGDAASASVDVGHTIASVAGLFFSALKASIDIRSLVSSIRVIRALKKAKQEAIGSGAHPDLVHAVDYAIRQKYEKVIKRAIGAATALATVGVGLAVLIANPVGAGLAAMIIAGIGIGVLAYKFGRAVYKGYIKKNKGKKRMDMALTLIVQLKMHDPLAREAVRSLHLDPDALETDPNAVNKIIKKLKSA